MSLNLTLAILDAWEKIPRGKRGAALAYVSGLAASEKRPERFADARRGGRKPAELDPPLARSDQTPR